MQSVSFLRNIFPSPKYITLPNVGVDISDSSVKYVQFVREHANDANLTLEAWGEVAIPEGVVERGDVHDVQKLGEVLREVRRACGATYVRLSLPEERAYLFETTIRRGTPFNEIRGMLEFKLEENVPLSPREAYFDYDIVDGTTDADQLRVVVAVYAKDTINAYYEACRNAGMMPLSFEIEAQAIGRATIAPEAMGTHMIVDFGKTRTGIGIMHEGALMYTSTVEVGGQDLTAALKQSLGTTTDEEVMHLKNAKGLLKRAGNEVRTALEPSVQTVVDALQTRMQYWYARDAGEAERTIEKIVLCGGSANVAGLQDYLAEKLQVPVACAAVWQNAFSLSEYIPPIELRKSFGYATAIGLALTDFIQHTP